MIESEHKRFDTKNNIEKSRDINSKGYIMIAVQSIRLAKPFEIQHGRTGDVILTPTSFILRNPLCIRTKVYNEPVYE